MDQMTDLDFSPHFTWEHKKSDFYKISGQIFKKDIKPNIIPTLQHCSKEKK